MKHFARELMHKPFLRISEFVGIVSRRIEMSSHEINPKIDTDVIYIQYHRGSDQLK